MKDSRASTNIEEFDVPMTTNVRRATINQNEPIDEEDGDEMLIESVDSLVIYDRSCSIKPPALKDFNFVQKLGNGSFGNVRNLPDHLGLLSSSQQDLTTLRC